MRRYMFNADAGDVDGTHETYSGFAPRAAESPALTGQRAGTQDGRGTGTLAAEQRTNRV